MLFAVLVFVVIVLLVLALAVDDDTIKIVLWILFGLVALLACILLLCDFDNYLYYFRGPYTQSYGDVIHIDPRSNMQMPFLLTDAASNETESDPQEIEDLNQFIDERQNEH